MEGHDFHVIKEHKPLTYTLAASSDKYTPRQIRHLDYISQFTTNIWHITRYNNAVVDALSRNPVNTIRNVYTSDTSGPHNDGAGPNIRLRTPGTPDLLVSIFSFDSPLSFCIILHYYDVIQVYTSSPYPFVPALLCHTVFKVLHSLSHPGVQVTQQLISEQFVRPGIKDTKHWTRTCLPCQ